MVIRAAYRRPRVAMDRRAREINVVVLPFTVGGDAEAKDLYGLFDGITVNAALRGAQ